MFDYFYEKCAGFKDFWEEYPDAKSLDDLEDFHRLPAAKYFQEIYTRLLPLLKYTAILIFNRGFDKLRTIHIFYIECPSQLTDHPNEIFSESVTHRDMVFSIGWVSVQVRDALKEVLDEFPDVILDDIVNFAIGKENLIVISTRTTPGSFSENEFSVSHSKKKRRNPGILQTKRKITIFHHLTNHNLFLSGI